MGRRQGLQRSQVTAPGKVGLAALAACLACKIEQPEREAPGEPPPFHDQLLYDGPIVHDWLTTDAVLRLLVEVQYDAIDIGFVREGTRFARGGSHQRPEHLNDAIVAVPHDDRFWVWIEQTGETSQVRAARRERPEQSWVVLDLADDALAHPLVLVDRVAVISEHGIAHAPILGGPPGVLALTEAATPILGSNGHRLVWVSFRGETEVIVGTDANFESVELIYERPRQHGNILGVAPVGDSVVFVGYGSTPDGSSQLVLRRRRADGSVVELVRAAADQPELLADGKQAWLYADRRLWWIGPRSHARIVGFDAIVQAIGADDGLLVWQEDDEIHVAGQPTIEFAEPFHQRVAIGGDDEDVWAGVVGAEVGEAYGIGGAGLIEGPSIEPPPVPIIELAKAEVDGALDRDVIRRIVRAHVNEIRRCYATGLEAEPSLAGTIELGFVIDPDGRITKVVDHTTPEQFADLEVRQCITRALRRWKFPKPHDGQPVTVRYPIRLQPPKQSKGN